MNKYLILRLFLMQVFMTMCVSGLEYHRSDYPDVYYDHESDSFHERNFDERFNDKEREHDRNRD